MRIRCLSGRIASLVLSALFAQAALSQDISEVENSAEASDADVDALLDPSRPITSLQELDDVIDALTRTAWGYRTLADDDSDELEYTAELAALWDKYLLAGDARQHLADLSARATRESEAGDTAALEKTIAEAAPLVSQQQYRMLALLAHSKAMKQVTLHEQSLRPWIARAPDTQRATVENEIATARTGLQKRLDDMMTLRTIMAYDPEQISRSVKISAWELNRQRASLVRAQSELPNPIPLEPRTPSQACSFSVPPAAGKEKPTVLSRDFPSTEEFYPADAKAADIQGAPTVRVSVAATGCPERVAIETSSGDESLDAAALELALAGKYVPAMHAGRAAAGEMVFRVKFELREAAPGITLPRQPDFVADPNVAATSLDMWDAIDDYLLRYEWWIEDAARMQRWDGRGIPPRWNELVMPAEVKARLATLRARAVSESAAGNAKALKATLGEASPLLSQSKYRAFLFGVYATQRHAINLHVGALVRWLPPGQTAEMSAAQDEVDVALAALKDKLKEMMATPPPYEPRAVRTLMAALDTPIATLNSHRARLAAAAPVPTLSLTRTAPCPAPVTQLSADESPKLGPDFPSTERYYPPLAKRGLFEGTVAVRAFVAATGCVERVELMTSSGAPELDQAGVELALAGSYLPGSKEGKAVAGELRFRVAFKLRERVAPSPADWQPGT